MNSLHRVFKDLDGSTTTHLATWPKNTHVLSVGQVDDSFLVHDAMLGVPNSRLSIATDCRELWVIPKQELIHLVILHNSLSLFELEESCRFIRQQWPQAKILVVRWGVGFLYDGLYDDRVGPTVTAEVLLTTIERLIGETPRESSSC